MRYCEESCCRATKQSKSWIAARPLDGLGVARNDSCERLPHLILKRNTAGAGMHRRGN